MRYSYRDYMDGECTQKQYYSQFNSVTPELGGVYYQYPGKWNEAKLKIVFVDDRIALGVELESCATRARVKGGYQLFYSNGHLAGWDYPHKRTYLHIAKDG